MKLHIENIDSLDLNGFCNYLIVKLSNSIIKAIVPLKCSRRDKEINETNFITHFRIKQKLSTQNLIKQGASNLDYKKLNNGDYEIFIDPHVLIYGTKTPLEMVLRLIEYGTVGVTPLPTIRKVFKEYSDDIVEWYKLFLHEEREL